MKNSAAVPSGAAEKRRLKDLTKLMPITFARYLASLTVYVASSQSAPFIHHALPCRSTRRVMSSHVSARWIGFCDPRFATANSGGSPAEGADIGAFVA